jgi:ferric-dicitrate binding protein FerR (iron transport regulator)
VDEGTFGELADRYLDDALDELQAQRLLAAVERSPGAAATLMAQAVLHQHLRDAHGRCADAAELRRGVVQRLRARGQSGAFRREVLLRLPRAERTRRPWRILLPLAGAAALVLVSIWAMRAPNAAAVVVACGGDASGGYPAPGSPAHTGMRLSAGDIFASGSGAAEIRLADGSTVTLASGTRVALGAPDQVTVALYNGRIEVSAAPRSQTAPPIVGTALLSVRVRGTRFTVAAAGDQAGVAVREGRVSVRAADGRDLDLEAGESAKIAAQAPLPAAVASPLRLRRHGERDAPAQPWTTMAVDSVAGLGPLAPEPWHSRFGGCRDRALAAPGGWRVQEQAGRWWLVDPDGCAFIHAGIGRIQRNEWPDADEDAAGPARAMRGFLAAAGCTGAGPWSGASIAGSAELQALPEVTQLRLADGLWLAAAGISGADLEVAGALAPLLPGFTAHAADAERALALQAAAGEVMAVVGDFDLKWRLMTWATLRRLTRGGALDTAVRGWLAARGRSWDEAGADDAKALRNACRESYLATAQAALRRAVPGALWFGPILTAHDLRDDETVPAVAATTTALAVCLRDAIDDAGALAAWHATFGLPLYVVGMHAGLVAGGALPDDAGLGPDVETMADGGRWFQHAALTLLRSRCVIGWSWDTELPSQGARVGAPPPVAAMAELDSRLYGIVQALDRADSR